MRVFKVDFAGGCGKESFKRIYWEELLKSNALNIFVSVKSDVCTILNSASQLFSVYGPLHCILIENFCKTLVGYLFRDSQLENPWLKSHFTSDVKEYTKMLQATIFDKKHSHPNTKIHQNQSNCHKSTLKTPHMSNLHPLKPFPLVKFYKFFPNLPHTKKCSTT